MTLDLVIDPLGDLQLTPEGFLATESNHAAAIKRRLTTPVGGYTRAVRDPEGWVDLDSNYFCRLPELLSLPATDVDISTVEDVIIESLAADSRIEVLTVNKSLGTTNVGLELTYLDLVDNSINTVSTQ